MVCDPAKKDDCTPDYPVVAGSDFFVKATADSGLAVDQRVIAGPATPVAGKGIVHYRANDPGVIVIRASIGASAAYSAAAPVDLIIQVAAEKPSLGCTVLGPAAATLSKPIDVSGIVSLLGNPTPFVLVAQGPNTILIYSTRWPLKKASVGSDEHAILDSFEDRMNALAGRNAASLGLTSTPATPFTVELTIPHAAALGDLATRISGLNYSQFTAQDAGSDRVRITAATPPDCDTWTAFLSDIRHMEWQLTPEPMNARLFYLSSTDAATAFTGLASASSSSTNTATATGGSTSVAGSSSGSSTGSSTTPAASSSASAAGSSSGSSAATPNASISVNQPPGSVIQFSSDTTPCVIAGLTFGNGSGCAPATATVAAGASSGGSTAGSATAGSGTGAAAQAAKAPLGMTSMGVAMGAGEQTPSDLLVFSDANAGDDAQVTERKRILAQLDLPRPEMVINAWVMQNSSTSGETIGAFSSLVKDLVAEYNREFESVVLNGWADVKRQTVKPDYFNQAFHAYVSDRFIADTFSAAKPGQSWQAASQAFLDASQANMVDPGAPMKRTSLGICERGRYCLGFHDLFRPLKPRLTDLLLTLIAANDPVGAADSAIRAVEGTNGPALKADCEKESSPEMRNRCRAIWRHLGLDLEPPPPLPPPPPDGGPTRFCASQDYELILGALLKEPNHEPRVHLRCFAEAVYRFLGKGDTEGVSPYGAGLVRAAIADFLFNYKLSQQYPHEFTAYDLSQSADALNSALSPLVDAFNRDLTAYQMFVRADMQYRVERINSKNDGRCCAKKLFGVDKPSFFNDGLVTVRTISGQATTANATSQSFLDASTAPLLSSLLSSVAGANPLPSPNTPAAPPPLISAILGANPMKRAELLAGALANYQTTYAQIGRSLQLSAIPRSLSTASSAEIAITLNVDESAGGPLYTGGGLNNPSLNTSRVANHDTTTRVRVDSVKLFEVSSFSAIVERSKSRFPLLPPFVEIPYIGTFVGIPLGPVKEYHSSTAVLSAMVVPTASDIAYGLRFGSDLVVDGDAGPCSYVKGSAGADVTKPCRFRQALSMKDLNREPIREFNKKMVRCLSLASLANDCESVSFDSVPRREY
jgi:hypothetical protein